mmetsp:Transcript_15663/g.26143  ORF Transcript_15663/g.26143 Transcript_15663/m.26143 type:complete len:120 (-) Transcript_15663:1194-1553(-)
MMARVMNVSEQDSHSDVPPVTQAAANQTTTSDSIQAPVALSYQRVNTASLSFNITGAEEQSVYTAIRTVCHIYTAAVARLLDCTYLMTRLHHYAPSYRYRMRRILLVTYTHNTHYFKST